MKARNQTVQGMYVTYQNGGYFSTTNAAAMNFVVTPAGMNRGNFRNPTAWQYVVKTSRYWKGEVVEQSIVPGSPLYNRVGYFGSGVDPPAPPTWERSSVYNEALEKLNSKVRGDLDLSIALAESGTTYRMVKSLSKVFDFARAVKRRFGSTKDIANGWLQWQYGWKPLVSDVFNVLDERNRLVLNNMEKFRVRRTRPIMVDQLVLKNVPFLGSQAPVRVFGKGKASCEIAIAIDIPAFDLARWTSLNPVSIAWELTPYSFVFDWFLDVGSYLRNLETGLLYGSLFRWGYVSELFVYDGTEDVDPKGTYLFVNGNNRAFAKKVQAKYRHRQFQRSVLTSYPLPRKPSFKADLGSYRLLSAAALLRQLLK